MTMKKPVWLDRRIAHPWPQAYAVQSIAQELMAEFARRMGQG